MYLLYPCPSLTNPALSRTPVYGGHGLDACTRSLRTWEQNIPPKSSSVKFRTTIEASPRGNDSNNSTTSNFHSQKDRFPPKPHQVYKYDLVHPHANDHTSRRLSLASAGHQIYAHADIYIRRSNQDVSRKPGRQFFGIGVRGIRTSSQDDAKDGYNLDWRGILRFGKEFYQIELCVRAKVPVARVQATLKTPLWLDGAVVHRLGRSAK